ncbi:MAG TPA: class I SAM-dependent methyltransferase [Amycolatopsis sp.]|jgi:SAM-dependent methyltransferase|nr:class I SAM-dependent methyltransferase [Amycolatopsis sp.]
MGSTQFDPVRFKTMQRANWNAMSGGWLSWQHKFERGARAVTERLLDLGAVGPGRRVLDIGTGIGEPALTAAGAVGAAGRVTGIDLARDMVEIARGRAAGLPQAEFAEGDLESLALPAASFDTVISRWALMFAVDHVAAFREVARVLVPGGILAAAVWGPPETAVMVNRGYEVLKRRLGLPDTLPGEPSPYSMADPEQVHGELKAAGFTDISVTEFEVPFWLESEDDYVEFYRTCSPPGLLTMIRERFGSEDDPETWAAIAASVEPYRVDGGGIPLPSIALLIRAVHPGD